MMSISKPVLNVASRMILAETAMIQPSAIIAVQYCKMKLTCVQCAVRQLLMKSRLQREISAKINLFRMNRMSLLLMMKGQLLMEMMAQH